MRKTRALLAGVAGLALLIPHGGTFALWTAASGITADAINVSFAAVDSLTGCEATIRPLSGNNVQAEDFPVFVGSAVRATVANCVFTDGTGTNPTVGSVDTTCAWEINEVPQVGITSCQAFTVPSGTPDHAEISVTVTSATYRGAAHDDEIETSNTITVSPRPFMTAAFAGGIAPTVTSATSSNLCPGSGEDLGYRSNFFTVHNIPSNAHSVQVRYRFEVESNVLVRTYVDAWLFHNGTQVAAQGWNISPSITTNYRDTVLSALIPVAGQQSVTIEQVTRMFWYEHNVRIIPNWMSFTFLDNAGRVIEYRDAAGGHLPNIGALATMVPGRFTEPMFFAGARTSCETNGRFRMGAGSPTHRNNEVPCPQWSPFRQGGTNHLTNTCVPAFRPASPLLPHTPHAVLSGSFVPPADPGFGYPGEYYYPGDNYPGTSYPGDNYPGTSLPGDNYPGTSLPGDNYPGTSLPGDNYPGTSYPGDNEPGTSYPGDNYPGTSYPGDNELDGGFDLDGYQQIVNLPGELPTDEAPAPVFPTRVALLDGQFVDNIYHDAYDDTFWAHCPVSHEWRVLEDDELAAVLALKDELDLLANKPDGPTLEDEGDEPDLSGGGGPEPEGAGESLGVE